MTIPAIIYLVLLGLGALACAHQHGKVAKISFPARAIAAGINLGLLYWGGFFG